MPRPQGRRARHPEVDVVDGVGPRPGGGGDHEGGGPEPGPPGDRHPGRGGGRVERGEARAHEDEGGERDRDGELVAEDRGAEAQAGQQPAPVGEGPEAEQEQQRRDRDLAGAGPDHHRLVDRHEDPHGGDQQAERRREEPGEHHVQREHDADVDRREHQELHERVRAHDAVQQREGEPRAWAGVDEVLARRHGAPRARHGPLVLEAPVVEHEVDPEHRVDQRPGEHESRQQDRRRPAAVGPVHAVGRAVGAGERDLGQGTERVLATGPAEEPLAQRGDHQAGHQADEQALGRSAPRVRRHGVAGGGGLEGELGGVPHRRQPGLEVGQARLLVRQVGGDVLPGGLAGREVVDDPLGERDRAVRQAGRGLLAHGEVGGRRGVRHRLGEGAADRLADEGEGVLVHLLDPDGVVELDLRVGPTGDRVATGELQLAGDGRLGGGGGVRRAEPLVERHGRDRHLGPGLVGLRQQGRRGAEQRGAGHRRRHEQPGLAAERDGKGPGGGHGPGV